jgi:hypothetical protein
MKQRQWTVQRKTIPKEDAQIKWDLAYQCLLKWAQKREISQEQEVQDESSDLRQGINARTS